MESLLNNAAGLKARSATLVKRDFSTNVFQLNLQNLQEHFFYRTALVAAPRVFEGVETKTSATVSNKYQIQLKQSIYCSEKPEAATLVAL